MPVLKIWSLALLYQNLIYCCFLGPLVVIGLPFEIAGSIPGLIFCYILLKVTPVLNASFYLSTIYVFLIIVLTASITSWLTILWLEIDKPLIGINTISMVGITAAAAFFSALTLFKSIRKTILSYEYQTTS